MEPDAQIVVKHNKAENRFEAGPAVLEYRRAGASVIFVHTEVPPELEGKGIAGKLAQAGLEYARREKLKVIPRCPFVAAYIKRHAEYQDLLRN